MKKVVLASFLACAVLVSGLPSAFAQAAPAAAAPAACPPMPDAEYKAYTDAIGPPAKPDAIEAYLTAFPQSCVKLPVLLTLMSAYAAANDTAKVLDAADRVLQLDPNNLQALIFEAYLRKQAADAVTDPAAKQTALDTAAGYAQKGLAAPKPAGMSDDDFKKLEGQALPIFYGVIGAAALNKKDAATAIDAYKKELGSVPVAQTQAPGPQLQDTYYLGVAYLQSAPPDLLDCAYYVARFVAFAPEPYKTQYAPTAKYCYKKYHGGDDGYDAITSAAQANLNPPDGLFASIKPAPTPAEQIHGIITSTPDLATLAIGDKEMVFQYGSPDDAAKVWDTIKGKSVEIPDTLVVASTPTQLQVAVSDDAKQSKTADFTFNLKAPEAVLELPEHATPAQKLAYKKKQEAAQKEADDIAAATAVGKTVTLDGTYESFTPKPIMITMSDGEVVLPKKTPAKAPAKAPVHRPAAKK